MDEVDGRHGCLIPVSLTMLCTAPTLESRYEQRSGEIQSDSPVEDIFDEHSNEENEMTLEAFESCMREWGVTKSEMHFYFRE